MSIFIPHKETMCTWSCMLSGYSLFTHVLFHPQLKVFYIITEYELNGNVVK